MKGCDRRYVTLEVQVETEEWGALHPRPGESRLISLKSSEHCPEVFEQDSSMTLRKSRAHQRWMARSWRSSRGPAATGSEGLGNPGRGKKVSKAGSGECFVRLTSWLHYPGQVALVISPSPFSWNLQSTAKSGTCRLGPLRTQWDGAWWSLELSLRWKGRTHNRQHPRLFGIGDAIRIHRGKWVIQGRLGGYQPGGDQRGRPHQAELGGGGEVGGERILV